MSPQGRRELEEKAAHEYAALIRDGSRHDWPAYNADLLTRFSRTAFMRIKRRAWQLQAEEWEAAAVEAFAAAWYRAHGFSQSKVNPRWEFVDDVIRIAWRAAAQRYVATGVLHEPVLAMAGSEWVWIAP
jgi:hypothetical protein